MLVSILKWTQFVVSIAATILASLIWPGVMVLIPVGIGILYIILAAGACRDRRLSMWLAFLMSAGIAVLTSLAIGANDFAVLRIDSELREIPFVAVSPSGDVVELDSISDETMAELQRIHAASARSQTVMVILLIFVSLGSGAVLVMHAFAWRWLVFSRYVEMKEK